MSKRVVAVTVIGYVLSFGVPIVAFAAPNLPLLNPDYTIVPDATKLDSSCPADAPLSSRAVLQLVQNLINLGISLGIVFVTLFLIWAGFSFIMSATNAEARGHAKKMLTNAVIGILIVLSAWLIVDFIIKTVAGGETTFGPWNSILQFGDEACIKSQPIKPIAGLPGLGGAIINDGVIGGPATGGGGGAPSGGTGGNCPAADPSGMVSFPSSVVLGAAERATPSTVQNFMAMRAAALKAGFDIKVTDGYRPEQEQVSLWNQRASIGQVAKPCSLGGNGSNHNSGVALDLSIPGCRKTGSCASSGAYQWLKANGANYGFRNSLPGTDNIHWSPSGR